MNNVLRPRFCPAKPNWARDKVARPYSAEMRPKTPFIHSFIHLHLPQRERLPDSRYLAAMDGDSDQCPLLPVWSYPATWRKTLPAERNINFNNINNNINNSNELIIRISPIGKAILMYNSSININNITNNNTT